MDTKMFIAKVKRLHPLQSVALRFGANGTTGLRRLQALISSNSRVRMDDRDKALMFAVAISGNWGGSAQNRDYTVYGLSCAEEGMLEAIGRDVEHMTIGQHGAQSLMTGRQKLRDEAAAKLASSVLTSEFCKEIQGLGINTISEIGELESLPFIKFALSYEDQTIAAVVVDGWSGRIAVNGTFGNEMYVRPQQIQNELREQMNRVLEKLTAAA